MKNARAFFFRLFPRTPIAPPPPACVWPWNKYATKNALRPREPRRACSVRARIHDTRGEWRRRRSPRLRTAAAALYRVSHEREPREFISSRRSRLHVCALHCGTRRKRSFPKSATMTYARVSIVPTCVLIITFSSHVFTRARRSASFYSAG